MTVQLLINNVGDTATTFNCNRGTTAGYDDTDLIAGPRSTMWRSNTVANTIDIEWRSSTYPAGANNMTASHVVIVRADILTRGRYWDTHVDVRYNDQSSGVLVALLNSAVTTSSCIGITSQDYVQNWNAVAGNMWRVSFQATTSTGLYQTSKICFCNAFDFGLNPALDQAITWQEIDEFFIPNLGTISYKVESRLQMTFKKVTRAKITAFKALAQLHNWPFFIYDSAAEVLPWKIEHVILEGYEETMRMPDQHDITLTFLRLKHYD